MSRTGLFGRAACLALTLAAAPGCGDPAASRLAAGSRAVVVDRDEFDGRPDDRVYLWHTGQGLLPGLVYGTHVSVVDDRDEPEHDWVTRHVVVRVEDGEHRGIGGTLARWNLRPE